MTGKVGDFIAVLCKIYKYDLKRYELYLKYYELTGVWPPDWGELNIIPEYMKEFLKIDDRREALLKFKHCHDEFSHGIGKEEEKGKEKRMTEEKDLASFVDPEQQDLIDRYLPRHSDVTDEEKQDLIDRYLPKWASYFSTDNFERSWGHYRDENGVWKRRRIKHD